MSSDISDSPCSIKVKNTFVEFDDYVDEDLDVRNVRSEPTSPTHRDAQQEWLTSTTTAGTSSNMGSNSCSLLQAFARAAQLSIDTEGDVAVAPSDAAELRSACATQKAQAVGEGEQPWPATPEGNFYGFTPAAALPKPGVVSLKEVAVPWPSTPEGNFLPCYQRLSFQGRLSSLESVSTCSDAVASWAMSQSGSSEATPCNATMQQQQQQQQPPQQLQHMSQQLQHMSQLAHGPVPGPVPSAVLRAPQPPPLLATCAPTVGRMAAMQMMEASPSGQSDGEASSSLASQSQSTAQVPPETANTGRLVKAVAIAKVQELLQSSEHSGRFKFPPGVKVLQWSYRQLREGRLAHRAVMSFLCNGVPQHVAGGWEVCKKTARQSAAEVALAKLQGRHSSMPEDEPADICVDLSHLHASSKNEMGSTSKDFIKKLEAHTRHCQIITSSSVAWAWEQDQASGCSRALVKIALLGMEHTFVGPYMASAELASAELSRRVLWFLGYRTCRGMYVVDRRRWVQSACQVPAAPEQWLASLQGDFVSE